MLRARFFVAVTFAARVAAFSPRSLRSLRPAAPTRSPAATVRVLSTSEPVAGPCVACGDEATYWGGGDMFVCTVCDHEWPVAAAAAEAEAEAADSIVKDAFGTPLTKGDSVMLIKDLGKDLKKGLKVTRIRLGVYGDGHDVQAVIPSSGTFNLKSQFLKKV
ncbi:hypothetical protein M885DRAFT_550567 [Pelagophyceae sp. CCMP2097]|nr:hypothetical protein M885DRAFT_550567 [Pelagophyceae sp. CCMP2097]